MRKQKISRNYKPCQKNRYVSENQERNKHYLLVKQQTSKMKKGKTGVALQ
jgi:hypothetical protein